MRNTMKSGMHLKACGIGILAIAVVSMLSHRTNGYSPEMRRAMMAGPWEIAVQISTDGQGLSFPIKVADENKPEKLDAVLPVMGTPIEIRLEQYIPDLKWETSVVKRDGGGTVAELGIKGPSLDQKFWLNTDDPARQSMSSPVGGVALKKLHDPNKIEKLMRELANPKAVGVLSIWPQDSNSALEYVVYPKETMTIPASKYKLTVLDYMPHYQIDTKTKEVVNQSKKPINPAIKVSVNDGQNTSEEWLWSKFPSSPHQKVKLPFRMRFTDFDLGDTKGQYILAAAPESKPWLLLSEDGKTRTEEAIFGRPYPFADEAYSFSIEKLTYGAVIKSDWKNNSENLLSPAIIVMVKNAPAQQIVLELNKTTHIETGFGTIALIYRHQQESL